MSGKPRRIVLLLASLGSGGAEKQAVMLANGLSSDGHDVAVITLVGRSHWAASLDPAVDVHDMGVEVGQWSAAAGARALRRARRVVRSRGDRPVLISFTFPAHAFGWALQARDPRLRHIVSERSSNLGSGTRVAARRLGYRISTLVTTNSEATKREITAHGLSPRAGVRVIPNYVDIDVPLASTGHSGSFRWVCVARLNLRTKDHESLLRAAASLKESGRAYTLDMVGTWPDEERIKALADELKLTDRVRFLGAQADVPSILAASDGLVLPSRWEGLPNAVLEAGAAGLSVVATAVGGTPEALAPAAREYLCRPGDPDELLEQMVRVMDLGPEERQQLGREQREYVRDRFSREQVLNQWREAIGVGQP